MTRRSWIQFGFLAAFWGASYLFIKVALDDVFEPPMIVFLRTALAALVLVPFALKSGALGALRGKLGVVAFLALLQVAAPVHADLVRPGAHLVLARGDPRGHRADLHVPAGHLDQPGGARARRRAGRASASASAGVVLLLGIDAGGGAAALLGGLMVVLASLGYALGAYYLKRNLSGIEPTAIVAATMAASALIAAPFAAFYLPSAHPERGGGRVAHGARRVRHRDLLRALLLADRPVGPAKASLVAYIAPGFAVIYGVVLLDESFTLATAAGLLLIVSGSWLAAEGRLPWQRLGRFPTASCPQAASMSRPRVRRTVAGTPAPTSALLERVDRLPA